MTDVSGTSGSGGSTGASSSDAARDSTRSGGGPGSASNAGAAASVSSGSGSDRGSTSNGASSSDAARDSARSSGGSGLGGVSGPDAARDSIRSTDSDDASSSDAARDAARAASRTTAESLAASPTTADDLAAPATTSERIGRAPSTANTLGAPAPGDDVTDAAIDATRALGAGNVGFSVPMSGIEINGRALVEPQMSFGRYAPNSRTPNLGVPIETFSRPDIDPRTGFDRGTFFGKQSMISSQAAFEHARVVDPGLRHTTFEARTPAIDTARTYDARIAVPGQPETFVEVKAGKSMTGTQLGKDIDLAASGTRVDYVFAENPVTGNHGPDAANQARLDRASRATDGRLSSTVADIEVGRQFDRVASASRFSRVARGTSKVLGPAAAVLDGYNIYSAVKEDGGFGPRARTAVGEAAGGWAGAAGGGITGAKAGAMVGAVVGGPAGAAVGAVVGGTVGAIGGAIAGSSVGGWVSSWFD